MKQVTNTAIEKTIFFKSYYLIIALILLIATGAVCGYIYQNSPKHALEINEFRQLLSIKEKQAAKTLADMNQIIVHSSVDSLIHYPFVKNSISYYVYENDELVFWSDNQRDVSTVSLPDSSDWRFVQLPNAFCISRIVKADKRKLMALITIKNNYPYENVELNNSFAKGFNLDKKVQLIKGNNTDKMAVFSLHGKYLFTLAESKTPVYNET